MKEIEMDTELRDYNSRMTQEFVGWQVERIVYCQHDNREALDWHLAKDGSKKIVCLGATDLGMWVAAVRPTSAGKPRVNVGNILDFVEPIENWLFNDKSIKIVTDGDMIGVTIDDSTSEDLFISRESVVTTAEVQSYALCLLHPELNDLFVQWCKCEWENGPFDGYASKLQSWLFGNNKKLLSEALLEAGIDLPPDHPVWKAKEIGNER